MSLARTLDVGSRRGAMIALALMSLAVRILVPQGFMVAPEAAGRDYALVICTGHGVLDLSKVDHDQDGAPKSAAADAPCAFAGMATPTLGSGLLAPLPRFFTAAPAATGRLAEQTPGRGLAAPPPPSHAPPRPI